jgi:ubiquinone/menaquinone biosynthesis C-methylase UbiE
MGLSLQQRMFDAVDLENRRVLLASVERNQGACILDCGCNDGDFTKQMAERIGTTQVYGIECVEEVARVAEGKGIKVYRTDLNKRLPIEDETFDFVYANQSIEHVYETDVFIKEVYRVLRKGGYAVFSTPNLASLHNVIALVFGKQPFPAHVSNEVIVGTLLTPLYYRHLDAQAHIRVFTCDAMKQLFEYHGFRAEKVIGVGYYPFPIALGKLLSRVDKRHSVYLTMKMRK